MSEQPTGDSKGSEYRELESRRHGDDRREEAFADGQHGLDRGIRAYEAIRRADEEASAAAESFAMTAPGDYSSDDLPRSIPAVDSAHYPNASPLSSRATAQDLHRSLDRRSLPHGSDGLNSRLRSNDSRASSNDAQQPYSSPYPNRLDSENNASAPKHIAPVEKRLSKLWFWRRYRRSHPAQKDGYQEASQQASQEASQQGASQLGHPLPVDAESHNPGAYSESSDTPSATKEGRYVVTADGSLVFVPEQTQLPIWWRKQPYFAIAHILAVGGTVIVAWFVGILAAQILPGSIRKPPLQEATLRRSSRLAKSLWHFPQLWQSQTNEVRIEAIPVPDTGPVTERIQLSPIERQPLIDELNAIETEVLTIERRIQILEKRMGRPAYEGADIDQRVKSLRVAIDPPVEVPAESDYTPQRTHPSDRLLEVAERKITLPADALFSPGQSTIKNADILTAVLDQLVNYPGASVVVRSYSDSQASASDSRDYTLAQANALSQHLQAALPEKYRWITVGGGATRAIASNKTVPGRQRNRRIEILIDIR